MARGSLSRNFFIAGESTASSLSNALFRSFRNDVPAKHSTNARLKYSAESSDKVRPVRASAPIARASTRQNFERWTDGLVTGNPACWRASRPERETGFGARHQQGRIVQAKPGSVLRPCDVNNGRIPEQTRAGRDESMRRILVSEQPRLRKK